MSIVAFTPEVNAALHKLVHSKYAKDAGLVEGGYEIRVDPNFHSELQLDVDYTNNKFIITTRYVPIGQLAERFDRQMRVFFRDIFPKFARDTEGKLKYNDAFHSLSFTDWWGKKPEDVREAKFTITNLVGVRVTDKQTGAVVVYIEENSTLQDVRDRVITAMYGESR